MTSVLSVCHYASADKGVIYRVWAADVGLHAAACLSVVGATGSLTVAVCPAATDDKSTHGLSMYVWLDSIWMT